MSLHKKSSLMEVLDDDCLEMVLLCVDVVDLCNVALCCSRFATVLRRPGFARRLLDRNFPLLLRSDFCRMAPLLPVASRGDVDPSDLSLFVRFLWTQRRHRARLTGLYEAWYGTHGLEFIWVEQSGYALRATKITGDVNVPAGVVTFEVVLDARLDYGVGRIQLARTGFRSPFFGRAVVAFEGCDDASQFSCVWLMNEDDETPYDAITAETVPSLRLVATRLLLQRSRHSLQRVQTVLATLPRDALNNVDRHELARRLEESYN